MNNLAGLISNIELFIRYLLSGVVIYAIFLLSICDTSTYIAWINKQPVLAGLVVGSLGFTSYSVYRIIFWIVGDGIAWHLGISAPALERGDSKLYHGAYASFLLWRREPGFNESLNGYLHYRWAVVHFTYIVAFALWFALAFREAESLIDVWRQYTDMASLVLFVIALWQSSFLFRVERELYRMHRSESKQSDHTDSPVSEKTTA